MIALFGNPTSGARGVAHYHRAVLKRGRLCLDDPDLGESDEPERQPLRSLIHAACRREWKVRLNDYGPRIGALEQTRDPDLVALSGWLRGRQPWNMKDPGEWIPRDALGLTRDLNNDAGKIWNRKTIFLVPDENPGTAADQKDLEVVIQHIAEELAGNLDQAVAPRIGFLRTRRADRRSKTESSAADILPGMVRRIFMANNQFLGKGVQFFERDGPLLMDGPTGTGKSMAAELIAQRLGKPFVKINIAAVSETLLESQMRGHSKGAYTDAATAEDGWFAKADGGVLFLDEFQNASLVSQTQLLDLLDAVSNVVLVNRLGESQRKKFNVKVILAANKPVDELLADGKLRSDLFYRIRDVVKLSSFNEILDRLVTIEGQLLAIRRLFYIYRWKASPYWDERMLDDADFASLFPVIDASVLDPIKNFQWDGNYRQFERFVSDIHWQNDIQGRAFIDSEVMLEHLREEHVRIGSKTAPVLDRRQASVQRHLREVEDSIRENSFRIGKTVESLKALKLGLGSRQSLRSFLKEHRDCLSPDIRADSKIVQFLQGRANGSVAKFRPTTIGDIDQT